MNEFGEWRDAWVADASIPVKSNARVRVVSAGCEMEDQRFVVAKSSLVEKEDSGDREKTEL